MELPSKEQIDAITALGMSPYVDSLAIQILDAYNDGTLMTRQELIDSEVNMGMVRRAQSAVAQADRDAADEGDMPQSSTWWVTVLTAALREPEKEEK